MATSSESEIAYGTLLDESEQRVQQLYADLERLAASLEPTEGAWDDFMVDLGFRLGLSGIHRHVMAARHELHGAQTEIVLARAQIARYRR